MSAEGEALIRALASGALAARDSAMAAELRQKVAELFGTTALYLRREGHDGAALLALLPVLDQVDAAGAAELRKVLALAWAGALTSLGQAHGGTA